MNSKLCRPDPIATPVRPHRDLTEFYPSQGDRADFVSKLFDRTARHYDRLSAALSFGTCKAYRREALRRSGLRAGMRMLDVATGTGLVARAALDLGLPPAEIIGVDPSRGMLAENRKLSGIALFQGRGESLPFASGAFDFVCMGYALRHVEDLCQLFGEFARVLKPGGRLLLLEITRPESRIGFAMGRLYLNRFMPAMARFLTRDPEAGRLIQYYWATIAECVPAATILAALSSGGFTPVERRRTGKVLSEYLAVKPSPS